jgi:uncharacterized membrane protein
MIGLAPVYAIAGAVFALYAVLSATDRRFGNAAFWGLLALSFLTGDRLGDLANGVLALTIAVLAGLGLVRSATPAPDRERRAAAAERYGNRLFVPALIVPLIAVGGTFAFKALPALVDPKQVTPVALTAGALTALAVCYAWLRPRPLAPFAAGLRVMDSVGWAALMPQMLASLGAVFALAGVGDAVGRIMGAAIPAGSLIGAVLAYAIGMAAFTIVTGNAFAAFPVMTAAIGVPLLIHAHHGDPAPIAAIGMLAGFCGTLLTPMAANFNLVPAALLDLKDRYGVIRAQAPTALILFAINLGLLYTLAFR